MADAPNRCGTVIAGKYVLTRRIGTGGMGAVYEARHKVTGKLVAVKVMHAHLAESAQNAARFVREAQAASSIGHPAIVDVLDAGTDQDGTLYIVLELLHGESLADVMERGGLYTSEIARYGVELLDALSAAHTGGFVHRDIKPENIFLVKDDAGVAHVKVLDFGISKRIEETDRSLTVTGAILGTPHYMSPEQARGHHVDARSDLWAVGALLYHALTGVPPFDGENYNVVMVGILTEPVRSIAAHRPDLPAALVDVIARALVKDRRQRWQTAAAMRDALVAAVPVEAASVDTAAPSRLDSFFRARQSDSLDSDITRVADGTGAPTFIATTSVREPPPRTPPRRVAVVAGVVLLGATALGVAFALARPGSQTPRTTADAPRTVQATQPPAGADLTRSATTVPPVAGVPPVVAAAPDAGAAAPGALAARPGRSTPRTRVRPPAGSAAPAGSAETPPPPDPPRGGQNRRGGLDVMHDYGSH